MPQTKSEHPMALHTGPSMQLVESSWLQTRCLKSKKAPNHWSKNHAKYPNSRYVVGFRGLSMPVYGASLNVTLLIDYQNAETVD